MLLEGRVKGPLAGLDGNLDNFRRHTSAQTTAARVGELDNRLAEILRAEAQLLALKKHIAVSLH